MRQVGAYGFFLAGGEGANFIETLRKVSSQLGAILNLSPTTRSITAISVNACGAFGEQ